MVSLLLYTHAENPLSVYLMWGVAFIVLVVLVIFAFAQRRTGKVLKNELEELDKVRQNNIEYEFILKAMKIAVWRLDPKRRVVTYDADFRDGKDNITSSPETPIDLLWDLLEPSDCQRVVAALEDIFAGRSDSYHQIYRIKTNTVMYWEESYATVSARDEEGLPTRIVGTSLRIDDQKQMEADLINARNKAEESDRLKTAFLANMGHEIRTPLNAIVGFADLLPMVDNEADRNQLISEIQINNRKLLRIIDGLVSMSKIEAEARNLIKSKTDLVELLNDVVKTFLPTIDQKTVSFSTQFPYPQLMLSTDVDKLKEIVINLLDNAIKFTQEGEIILGYEKVDDKCLRIWVKDTGIGVSEADQKKIFDRFVKLNDYVPGTGLGLAVAKSHIESLGGKIGVNSHVGEGSTFWVTLPMS